MQEVSTTVPYVVHVFFFLGIFYISTRALYCDDIVTFELCCISACRIYSAFFYLLIFLLYICKTNFELGQLVFLLQNLM